MTPDEKRIVELRKSIVHGLRSQGWPRFDAESEAEDRTDDLLHRKDKL